MLAAQFFGPVNDLANPGGQIEPHSSGELLELAAVSAGDMPLHLLDG